MKGISKALFGYVNSKIKKCSTGKVIFSKKEAQSVRNELERKQGFARIYHCLYCNHWHTTSQIKNKIYG